ncbi:alpha-1,2-mannosyltransferase [Kibdelosporangium banguiense]|uniref:Alpha-1,2-mannosyltransferase n=1 Tax=Kibdelosporangium banguiense TaxID=1365924 RepID=A0ABS4T5T0_9PSEU|nr:glycosyltransferase 87 family protein [Kibdelosporangium banguiense]MBP2319825.1 alpha-1,2-mannosyltransferase [Kibdelosporangium banguiense]
MRVLTAVAVLCCVAWFVLVADIYRLDLDVYRIGMQTWLAGGDLYGELPDTAIGVSLPFIYPPIAAVMMTPLAVVSFPVASIALTVLTVALVVVTLSIVLDSLGLSRRWLALVPLAFVAEPVWSTLDYGQINVILMALVVADCLVPKPRWPRGVLVGLAAAVKLTPAAFVLFFLLRRDNRAALTAAGAFLAATVLGFLVAPKESIGFWTNEVLHTGEKVGVDFVANQSIMGVLTRMDGAQLWPLFAAMVVVLAVIGMRGEPALALAVNSLAMLLVSPISWSHHWVWCVLIVPAFAMNGMRLLAVTGAALFVIAPHWWAWEEAWTVNAYAVYAVIALAATAVKNLRTTSLDPAPGRYALRRA